QGAPSDQRDETVRDRDRVEPQGQERVRPRNDVCLLPPEEQEHGPEQIGERRGGEQRAQRSSWRGAFGREGESVVSDEHQRARRSRAYSFFPLRSSRFRPASQSEGSSFR